MALNDSNVLASPWSFWYDELPQTSGEHFSSFGERIKYIGSFHNLASFYNYYAFVRPPSSSPQHLTLYCFRSQHKPMWEEYSRGGCWIIRLNKSDSAKADRVWENCLLSCIGEDFVEDMNVVGCSVSIRHDEYRISVWLSDTTDPSRKYAVCEKLRLVFELGEVTSAMIEFKSFSDSLTDHSTYHNPSAVFVVDPSFVPPVNSS